MLLALSHIKKLTRYLGLLGLSTAVMTPVAYADNGCLDHSFKNESTLNVRIDNDLFGGERQDQGYTNGFLVSLVSPNLTSYQDDPCLPRSLNTINRYLTWIQPEDPEELNMTVGIGQLMYTPTENEPRELIKDDRPYVGALLASIGYHARTGDRLRSTQLRFGVVGPASLGDSVQSEWHRIINIPRFRGWNNQLNNEPVFQLIHEQRYRWPAYNHNTGWGWDAIGHAGGSVGNFATYLNTGFELRFGYKLPDDFGTAPLSPGGENSAPLKTAPGNKKTLTGHAFVAVDGRWVVRDITLDGNTFSSSHSVKKNPFVADIGYGLAFLYDDWKFAFARYHRTREFRNQQDSPVYGTFTVSKRF